jgi:DsbC/DsbD-like thiol-disulfide interchange protein
VGATGIVAPMLSPSVKRRATGLALAAALATLALAGAACRRAPAPAVGHESPAAATRPAHLSVTAEPAPATPGGVVTLLWRFEPAAGWHLYWDGRNDSGFAPRQALRLPPGWSAGPLRWPVPTRHLSAGDILDHIYTDAFTLLQDVTVPPGAAPGTPVTLGARWDWLACREACVPGRDSLTVAVTVGAAPAADTPAAAPSAALSAARDRLPQPLPDGFLRCNWEGATCLLQRVHDLPGGTLTFLPATDCGELADLLHDGVGARLALRLLPQEGRCGPLRGILVAAEPTAAPRAFLLDVPAVPVPVDGQTTP